MERRTSTLVGAAIAAAALVALPPGGSAGAEPLGITLASPGTPVPTTYEAVAAGGVFFTTSAAITANDNDGSEDVYRWADGQVTLTTPGSPADVSFDAVTPDGEVVFGHTVGPCVVSGPNPCLWRFVGGGGSNFTQSTGNYPVTFEAAAPDGNSVLFQTAENWGGETDGKVDVLLDQFPNGHANNQTDQLSWSPNTAAMDVQFQGSSTNVHRVVFSTDEAVGLTGDHNAAADLYGYGGAWTNGSNVTLLSDGAGGADSFDAVAADGSAILYTTLDNNALPWNNDADGQYDIYWSMGVESGGVTQVLLVSGGTAQVDYAGATPDLGTVYYSTTAGLAGADSDSAADVYARTTDGAGVDVLVTPGTQNLDATFVDVNPAKSVVFRTEEQLAGDTDSGPDLYRVDAGGSPVLLSGPGNGNVTFRERTADGSVYFTTDDRLTSADTDNAQDVYANQGGTLTLLSGGTADIAASFGGASTDMQGATHVYFTTTEQLTSADTDSFADVYTFGPVTATPPPPPPDTTPPTATAAAQAQKNDGSLEVPVTCSEACTATSSGTLTVPLVNARGNKTFTLKGATVSVAAGGTATLKLKVPKKAKKAAAAALKKGKKVKAAITVVVADAAGNKRTIKLTLKLK